jgi:hypothetical protein
MYRVPHVWQNSGLCWGIQANPIPNCKASLLSVYKRTESTAGNHHGGSFYLCLSAALFWEAVTQIMRWELYEIWVKKQHRQGGMCYDICLPAHKYCLCQSLNSVWNCLWRMNNKQFIVGRSGSSESYVFGVALFCILPLLLPYVVLEDGSCKN